MKPPTAPAGKPPKAAAARKLPKAAQAALMATLADDDDDGEDDTPLDVRAATLLRQKRQDAPRVPSTRQGRPSTFLHLSQLMVYHLPCLVALT
jgi:hypothetical protein